MISIKVPIDSLQRCSRGVWKYYCNISSNISNDIKITSIESYIEDIVKNTRVSNYFINSDGIVWFPSFTGSILSKNQIITVHDTINIDHVYKGFKQSLLRRINQSILAKAKVVVAISNYTKSCILNNYTINQDKIIVIKSPNCVSLNNLIESEISLPCLNYILIVTNSLPHKNLSLFIDSYVTTYAFKHSVPLIIVGNISREHRSKLECLKIPCTVFEFVSDADLKKLYQNAALYVSPSIAEGHNLTIAEALFYGTKVLCSNIPAHMEFYRNSVTTFDPLSKESISSALDEALLNNDKCSSPDLTRTFLDVSQQYCDLFKGM